MCSYLVNMIYFFHSSLLVLFLLCCLLSFFYGLIQILYILWIYSFCKIYFKYRYLVYVWGFHSSNRMFDELYFYFDEVQFYFFSLWWMFLLSELKNMYLSISRPQRYSRMLSSRKFIGLNFTVRSTNHVKTILWEFKIKVLVFSIITPIMTAPVI